MHLLLKWNPERESDTLQRHMAVAREQGSSWWGCDTESRTRSIAHERIDLFRQQLREGQSAFAFVYRLGDPAAEADVWKAKVRAVSDRPEEVEENRRPTGYTLASSFLFVDLEEFEPVEPGWILDHVELWDQPGRLIDQGGLGNQTSPLYVAVK